ncbi:hypothetical protein F4801DRAFT_604441 [Xylaria longipes]|nr:hypothetical protein F4801DRAFT_604441 [Xylaria longipes]
MHPPLIYCPQSTQLKFYIVEEQECHLYPHHTPGRHLAFDSADTVSLFSPSNSGPSSEQSTVRRFTENRTDPPSVPMKCPTPSEACHDTRGGEVGKERLDQQNNPHVAVPDENTQPTGAVHQPTANGCLVNGSPGNHRISPSQNSSNPHEPTANSGNHQGETFETERLRPQYCHQQSSFNGYTTNRAYSGAPFDYRYHSHSDHEQRYYPYQQAASTPMQHSSPSYQHKHVYMEVEGPGRHYQYQGSSAPSFPNLGYSRIFPESSCGRNASVLESNPLRYNKNPTSTFNPAAATFDYWKTNPNLPSNSQAAISEAEAYDRFKSRKRLESLEQLRRSNKAAYYNCGHYASSSQGEASNDDQRIDTKNGHLWVGNLQPKSPNANGGYNATNADHKPRSRSHSCSESYSRKAPMTEVSSPITQEVNALSHEHNEFDTKGKGKEVIRNPTLSWINMSTPNSSEESVARGGSWNGNRDAGTQTNGHPVHYGVTDKHAKSLRCKEINSLPEIDHSLVNANSHEGLTSRDETINSDSTNMGIVSIKTESDDGDCQTGDPAELTPTKVKADPDNEVKLRDIPTAPAVQGATNRVRSDDSGWDADTEDRYNMLETPLESPESTILCPNSTHSPRSASECESQPIKQDDATPKPDMQKNDISQSCTISTHRSASYSAAPREITWSAVVSGKYIPSKSSVSCPPGPRKPMDSPAAAAQDLRRRPSNASSVSSWNEVVPPPSNTPTSCSLEPVERAWSSETLKSVWERRFPNGFKREYDVESLMSASTQTIERPDNVSSVSDNVVGVAENTMQREVDGTASGETFQLNPGAESFQPPDNIASTSPTRSTKSAQLPETAPTASASTSVAPEPPIEPQPRRLWSQVLGGSKSVGVTKSDSSKDEISWPALGSSGPGKGRKRDTTS